MEDKTIYAWFEGARGPEDWSGVRLAYIDPLEEHFGRMLEQANKDKDTNRALDIHHKRSYYINQGQKFFTPDLGWWMSKRQFYKDEGGWMGRKKSEIEERLPNLKIFPTREDAVAAAQKDGVI